MNTTSPIIAGGGWHTTQTTCRPWARFFGFLSCIWIVISIGASIPFWFGWPQQFELLHVLCLAMLAAQPVWLLAAIVCLLRERPRKFTEELPNRDYHPRNLH